MERKLDLSRLSDAEAKHVWDVIQRDFNLRKTEEERLGGLKTRIQQEDSKQELLGARSHLSESLCVRCLQPFRFLVNSKRSCLDCRMFTCKNCSRYNKKEHGWVCDNCRMTRVLKIGTVGWYHDDVRNRFKRFGSAKVMRSLYKRLNGDAGRDDDTQSMPDVRSSVYNGMEEDDHVEEVQRYKVMRKNKRLLSVHPLDFDPEEYFPYSRRPSVQILEDRAFRTEMDYEYNHRANRRRSLDRYAMRPEEVCEPRLDRSLSKISSSVARLQYLDTSDEEESPRRPPVYLQPPHRRRNSRASSQEHLGQAPPMNELNKRMSAIESLLNRLEEKVTPADQTPSGPQEEEKLRRKLSELAGNLSDKNRSSDEEAGKKTSSAGPGLDPLRDLKDLKGLSSSSDEGPSEAQKRRSAAALCDLTTEVLRTVNATEHAMAAHGCPPQPGARAPSGGAGLKQADDAFRKLEENVYMAAGQSHALEAKLQRLERSASARQGGATDSELSELEDVVTRTAARVQSAESEVSDIESKIAALTSKKKVSGSQRKKSTQDFSKGSNGAQWKSNLF